MTIRLPIQCKGLELTDHEKLLSFVIMESYRALDMQDWFKYTLGFYAPDINRIIGRAYVNPVKNLESVFQTAKLNGYTRTFKFKNPQPLAQGNNYKVPAYFESEIHDAKVILLYVYLLGRFADPKSIISEDNSILRGSERSKAHHIAHIVYHELLNTGS